MDKNSLIILFFLLLLIVGLILKIRRMHYEAKKLTEKNKNLSDVNTELARFKGCVDAEATAKSILLEAKEKAEKLVLEADTFATSTIRNAQEKAEKVIQDAEDKSAILIKDATNSADKSVSEAMTEAKSILLNATNKADEIEKESIAIQIRATERASEIIQASEDKARAIAGNAYDIANKAEHYTILVESLKNMIEGYGNRYLKPTESVLDDLADEFGYTQAGQELTRVRKLRTKMSEDLSAATTLYVEKNRHDTAIRFIIDAFNGKVDSILSTVKSTNVGVLQQKIRDSYSLVNYLGLAFRETRITEEYLAECLEELRWAVAVIALKDRQKEEQRAIKEQIREEERARREYERAIKDAQKQEAAIKKAIEKATAQLAKSNEEQRLKYETQLLELQEQLAESIAKNQRALSMAQQTRSGHVYIISNIGSFGADVYKIGMTRRLEPNDRVRELGDASVPFPFDVHAMIFSEDAPALETELHKIFMNNQVNKVNPRKEFFRIPLSEIRKYFENKGLSVQWTLKAEAAQYRETLALEASFKNDEEKLKEWDERQQKELITIFSDDEDMGEDELKFPYSKIWLSQK